MAERRTPNLNLSPELTEVRSRDFNLFYKPEPIPQDKSVDVFTKSLDAFVRGAGTDLVIQAEEKQKKTNEAEAIKAYNENRAKFGKAVNKGEIPKEASPYFIEKYKELELNTKANQFKQKIYSEYARKNVLENPDPNAFDKFYDGELRKFVEANNLSAYDAIQLEKGFFSKTSGTRNSLLQNHVSSQMSKIGEEYKIKFKENIQTFFTPESSIEEIGANISGFVQDAVKNNLSKTTARTYLLEALMDYASNTGNTDFASKILRELPKNIKLGTDVIFNVKALEDDFNAIKEKIDERVDKKAYDANRKLQIKNQTETLEAQNFVEKFDTLSEAMESEEYKSFSKFKQKKVELAFKAVEQGYGSSTSPTIDTDVDQFIIDGDLEGAMDYLNANSYRMTSNYFEKKKEEINEFRITGKDGLLADDDYEFRRNKLQELIDQASKSRITITDPYIAQKYEKRMRKWLANNPKGNFANQDERLQAFNKFSQEYFQLQRDKIIGDQTVSLAGEGGVEGEVTLDTSSEKADINKLTSPNETTTRKRTRKQIRESKPTDKELEIDLDNVVIIPSNLKGRARGDFIRKNPDALSQEEFDRIAKKQKDNTQQLVAQAGSD
mgnify:CR=1 FL=1|tara:strand:+ start:336 stop:2162 length:1827 start_codon:yes stop_codon:yes gene_type:complete